MPFLVLLSKICNFAFSFYRVNVKSIPTRQEGYGVVNVPIDKFLLEIEIYLYIVNSFLESDIHLNDRLLTMAFNNFD